MLKRIQQVSELLKRELGNIILKEIDWEEDKNNLKEVLVTITRVIVSNNLARAKIYISVMPTDKRKKILNNLKNKVYFFQQKINKRLKMRPVPCISFVEEKETEKAGKVEELLEKIKNN